MNVGRRDCLRIGAAVGAGALLAGCAEVARRAQVPVLPEQMAPPRASDDPIVRLLNRIGYGPAPGAVEQVVEMGIERYVDLQLHPDSDDEPLLGARLRGIEVLRERSLELTDLPEHEILRQLEQASLLRAVYSRHQLRERMADFWSNHFNVYAYKGFGAYLKPADEHDAIRKHALGRFPDLVHASAHSPAMLGYLDNQVNRSGVPNENYARELLELHTLGVDGGYTQKDVQEVARCLTGWTIENRFLRNRGTFRFDPTVHDDGTKTVLGQSIPADGGKRDGERVLDIVSQHPSTARHIAGKLCRHFLGEGTVSERWTGKLAAIYRQTGGDISAMLRPLLLSDDLSEAPPILKRPYDYVASALRALGANTDGSKAVQEHLRAMGQPLHEWPMPDGYPEHTAAWTGSLLARWNFAFALASGGIRGTDVDADGLLSALPSDDADAYIGLVFGRDATGALASLRDRLDTHLRAARASGSAGRALFGEAAALLIASPEFQWR